MENFPDLSDQGSNLESPSVADYQATPVARGLKSKLELLHFNGLAFGLTSAVLGVMLLVGAGSFLFTRATPSRTATSEQKPSNFGIGSISLAGLNSVNPLQLGQADHLSINGQLIVNNGLVLTPSSAPSSAVAGQLYYDQATNKPYYYDGTQFVSLLPTLPKTVSSLGGSTGVVGLGSGLRIAGGQLQLSADILQATTALNGATSAVSSVQGQTGAVSFSGGNGIAVNGTAIVNTGLLSLGGAAGNLALGRGLSVQGGALKSSVSVSSASANLIIADDGNGNYTITDTSAASSQVILAPVAAQTDSGANTSLNINKTGSGNFLQLASNGVTKFVVDQTGAITTGSIGYAQVTGAPASTVTSLGGASGAIALGSGLGLVGGTLSNTGLQAVNGTANQVIATTVGGVVTLSLPQAIAITSSPSFTNLSLSGSTTVAGSTTLNGGVAATGSVSINTTGSSATVIGNNGASFSVSSTGLNLTAAGALSGLTTVSASGAIAAATTGNTINGLIIASGSLSGITGYVQTAGNFSQNGVGSFSTGSGAVSLNGATSVAGLGTGLVLSNASGTLSSGIIDRNNASYLSGLLSVANGGTGAATAAGARTNLGAAASGANSDITSLSAITSVGTTGTALTLQGNASSVFSATAAGFTTSLAFASPTANVNYQFATAAAGTYNVCTTVGNCAGVGGGVTTAGGSTGKLAKFTGSQSLGDSLLSEAGSTVTVGGSLAANTIAPTAAFLLGVTSQNVTVQGASVAISSTSGANTNRLSFATPAGASHNISLPNASGTVAVSASGPLALDANGNLTCVTCTTSGGGAGGAVDSLNGINGSVNVQGTANQIIVVNNGGTRTITLSTPQDINTSSSPTFASATLTNNLSVTNAVSAGSLSASGTLVVTGAATAASFNGLSLTANAAGFSVAGGTTVKTVTVTANVTLDQNLSTTSTPTLAGLNLTTALSVANGGTGATTAAAARANLGAAAAGANSDITSITGLTTALSAGQGGTGVNGSVAANGKLLIGNGAGYSLANLTQGSGISITNGAGSISIGVDNTICTTAGNCAGSGSGVTTAGGTAGTIALFTGTQAIGNSIISQTGTTISVAGTLTATALQGDGSAITNLNASNLATGTVASARLTGAYSGINGVGALTAGSISSGFGAISITNGITTTAALQGNSLSIGGGTFTVTAAGAITAATGITTSGAVTLSSLNAAGVVHTNGSGTLTTSAVTLGTDTAGNYIATLGTLTGLTTAGNGGAGSTPTISVSYGSTANTAAQGNTAFSYTPTGNLTGSLSGTAGAGFTTTSLAIVNNPTFSGLVSANGGLTVATATTLTNAGATLNTAVALGNLTTGAIGTAAATVDSATTFSINQTTAGQALTLPNPTNITAGRVVYINNVGSSSFTLVGNTVPAGQGASFEWNGSAWTTINNLIAGSGLTQSGNTVSSTAANSVVNDTNITGSIAGNILTLGYTGTLSVARGGTGSATAAGARSNLGAAASGANSDITSLSTVSAISNGSGALTAGNTNQALTLQGNASSVFTATAGSFTTSVGFASPTANVNYQFATAAAGTYNICTTVGNCAGSGGGVTTAGGTAGKLAKFTGAQSLGDSLLSESGSTVTVGGTLAVNTIAPTAALLLGVTTQNVTVQGAAVAITSTSGANTNTLNFATPSGASHTVTLPNANGTVAVSASGPLALDANGNLTCVSCTTSGGGAGGAVDSLNAINGAVTLQGTSNQIIVTNNSGTRTITVSTPQDINTTSNVTFGQVSVTNAVSAGSISTSGTLAVTGAATAASFNGLNLTANATGFTVAGGTAVRTVTVTSNVTLDQNLSTTSSPSFAGITSTGSLAVAGATSLGGTLAVNGATTLSGALAVTGVNSITTGTGSVTLGSLGAGIVQSTVAGLLSSGAVDRNSATLLSGTLSTANGGTGNTSYTTSGVVYYDGTKFVSTAASTGAQCLVSTGAGVAPTFGSCTTGTAAGVSSLNSFTGAVTVVGTTNQVTVANASNTLTLSLPQNINNTAAVQFGSLTLANSGTTSSLAITATANPAAGSALILANNTNAAPSGNLIDLQTAGASKFSVSATGAVLATGSLTAAGVNSGSGLIQGSGGLTITGATSITGAITINTTGTANTAIGNATGSFSVASSALNISSAGAISGVTTLSASGAISGATSGNTINGLVINSGALSSVTGYAQVSGNFAITGTGSFATGTGAVSLNGATTAATSFNVLGAATVGVAGTTNGSLGLTTSINSQISLLQASALTGAGNATFVLPSAAGGSSNTLCIQGSSTCGFAAASGSGSYINNSTALQATANFNIQSAAATSVGAAVRGAVGQTADLAQFQSNTGTPLAKIDASGNITTQNANVTGTQTITGTSGQPLFSSTAFGGAIGLYIDASGKVGIGNNAPTQALDITGNVRISSQLNVGSSGAAASFVGLNGTAVNIINSNVVNIPILLQTSNGGFGFKSNGSYNTLDLAANGATTIRETTDNATALQVQNAAAATVLAVDTTANQLNSFGNINFAQIADPAAAPTVVDAGAGSIGAGTYYYAYSYVTASGETAFGPVSTGVTIAASHNVTVTLANSPSALVIAKRIYRGTSNINTLYLVGTVNNNTTTSFTDTNNSPTTAGSDVNRTASLQVGGAPVLTVSNLANSNSFIGLQTGINNTIGVSNTGTGTYALQSNTSGGGNSAYGANALQANTTGTQNTAAGALALTNNTSGFNNTATGFYALYSSSTGSYNTATGVQSLFGNTTGGFNTASGFGALGSNSSGNQNTATGYAALGSNSSGNLNTATGNGALGNNNVGISNTASGASALNNNLNGAYNTAEGNNALSRNTSGSYNSAFGYYAGNQDIATRFATGNALQNTTAIGAYAQVQASNSIVLGSVDTLTKVGIGTTVPLNQFSVSPVDLNSATITATQTTGSGTITASAAIFSAANVGEEFIWADGTQETITGFTSTTVVTGSSTTITENPNAFRTHQIGLQVVSSGNVGVNAAAPTNKLTVNSLTTSNAATLLAQSAISTGAAGNVGQIVQGVASQTADLLQLQSSTGTVLTKVDSAGSLYATGPVTALGDCATAGYSCASQANYTNTYINGQNAQLILTRSGTASSALLSFNNAFSGSLATIGLNNTAGVNRLQVTDTAGIDLTAQGTVHIQAAASQTNDLLAIQDNAGNNLSKFGSNGQLTLGRVTATGTVRSGQLSFADGTTDNFAGTLSVATLTAARSYTLPDATGTICVVGSTSCSAAGTGYINNSTALQTGNFNLQSAAVGSVTASINGIVGQTANILQVSNSSGGGFYVGNDGAVSVRSANGNAFTVANNGQQGVFFVNATAGSTSSRVFIKTLETGNSGLSIGGSAGQTADLLQLSNDTGAILGSFDATGNLRFNKTSAITALANPTANGAGYGLTLAAGAANGSTTGAAGGVLALQGGAAAGTGNNNGGNITLTGGTATGTGTVGTVAIQGTGGATTVGGTLGVTGNVGIGVAPAAFANLYVSTADNSAYGIYNYHSASTNGGGTIGIISADVATGARTGGYHTGGQFEAGNTGSGTLDDLTGVLGNGYVSGTGAATNVRGGQLKVANYSTGSIANGYGLEVVAAINSGGGSIAKTTGIAVNNQVAAANNTNLLLGTNTIPTGNYSLYNSSAYKNYFAGNVGIGALPTSAVALDAEATNIAFGSYISNTTTVNSIQTYGQQTYAVVQGAASLSGSQIASSILSYNTGSGTAADLIGASSNVVNSGTGTSTIAEAAKLSVTNSGTGIINNGYGLKVSNSVNSGGGTIANNAGIAVENQTAAANNTNLLLGTNTIPTGNYSIYNASTYDNQFSGKLTVMPAFTGSASIEAISTNGTTVNPSAASSAAYYGVNGKLSVNTAGTNVTGAKAVSIQGFVINSGAGTLGTAVGVQAGNTGGGTITNNYGVQVSASNGNLTNNAGAAIDNQVNGINNANLLLGTTTIPTGNYSIYNSSAYNNYFAGKVGIGTASPAATLDVVANATGTNQLFSTFGTTTDTSGQVYNQRNVLIVAPTVASTATFTGLGTVIATNTTNTSAANLVGSYTELQVNSGGSATNADAVSGAVYVKGTASKASVFSGGIISIFGILTNAIVLQADNAINASGTITNGIGIQAANQTNAINNTNILVGATTAPAGNYSIYNSSAYNNYFAGNLGIANTAPANKLNVNTATTADSLAQGLIATSLATNKGLVIQGAASQTADLLQLQNSAGAAVFSFNPSGNPTFNLGGTSIFAFNGGTATGFGSYSGFGSGVSIGAYTGVTNTQLSVISLASTNSVFSGQAAAGQTANLLQLQNSSAAVLSTFDANGGLVITANANVLGASATNGTSATSGINVTGQKGGNTTGTTAQTAGTGASQTFLGGAGGDAPAGSTNGNGGSITLNGGAAGAGAGTAGTRGSIALQTTGGNVGVGTAAPSYKLDVQDSQAATYVARIQNTNTSTTASGLLVDLGIANASRTATNYFVGFASGGTVAGKIQGAASAVAYTTNGADYAEYFKADQANLPQAGEIVALNPSVSQSVLRGQSPTSAPLAGIVSTSPGFVGNGPICNVDDKNCDADYAKYNSLVALSGQVPAKVNASNGAIAIGDPITSSNVAGEGSKATGASYIVGYAMEPLASGSSNIKVLVRPQFFTPTSGTIQASTISSGSLQTTGDVNVGGNLNLAGSLNVSGATKLISLEVTGSVVIAGTLSVQGPVTLHGDLTVSGITSVADITVNGHIISANNKTAKTPTAAVTALAAACTTGSPTATMTGNDTAGTVAITTGTGTCDVTGALAKVTFASAYAMAPVVVLTPANAAAASLQYYYSSDANTMTINTSGKPTAATTYTYSYHVVQ